MVKRVVMALALALSAAWCAPEARACGGEDSGPVYVNARGPDLPLTPFTQGRVGVVQQGWSTSYLVVAYRHFTGVGLDANERDAAIGYWVRRTDADHARWIDPSRPSPTPAPATDPGDTASEARAAWRETRRRVAGTEGADITAGRTNRYAFVENCYADAFTTAAQTLEARARQYGAQSDAVRAWVEAQDQVFRNCDGQANVVPAELPPTTPLAQRHDRDYQIASALFYTGRHADAETRFRRIASDGASPWARSARYLLVRTLTRAAQWDRDTPDGALLTRAEREAEGILGDASLAPLHPMTGRYLLLVRNLRDPLGQNRAVATSLARDRLGADFGARLHDYAIQTERHPELFAPTPNDSDRLSAWVSLVHGGAATDSFTRSLALYRSTRSNVWLIASLMTAADPRDAALDPLLTAARAITPSDAAYATAQYHRLRIELARGRAQYADIVDQRARLTPEHGRSAQNLFDELAAVTAPDLERLLAVSANVPAGWEEGPGPILPPDYPRPGQPVSPVVSPAAFDLIARKLPLSVLVRAAGRQGSPAALRTGLARTAFARAILLDDTAALRALAPVVIATDAATRPFVDEIVRARTTDARRLAFVHEALTNGRFDAISLDALRTWAQATSPWESPCGTPDEHPPEPAGFLSATERAEFTREQTRWVAMSGRAVFLPREAARLAAVFPNDPRVPEVLHRAVQLARNNTCSAAAPIHAASRAAFQALHRRYPRSEWTGRTRYWY